MRTTFLLFGLLCAAPPAFTQDHAPQAADMPNSRAEHEEIQASLTQAAAQPGELGAAALALTEALRDHFALEEAIVLPPLSLIGRLADDDDVSDLQAWLLPMSDSVRAELPRMLAEHAQLEAARARLEEAARRGGNHEVAHLARRIHAHAHLEEQLLYPMAILTGEIVRARRRPGAVH